MMRPPRLALRAAERYGGLRLLMSRRYGMWIGSRRIALGNSVAGGRTIVKYHNSCYAK